MFEGLTGLEEAWIFENGITTVSTGVFRGLPGLRDLFLHENRISRLAPGAFAGLASMERLVLHRNRIAAFPFDEFEALPALRRLFITDNPGHKHAIEASVTSLAVPLGGSATYRLRLTASPSIHGARVALSAHEVDVDVVPTVLEFTQDGWFRSRLVTVSADGDAAPGSGRAVNEMLTGNYAYRMADPAPEVRVRVGWHW